MLLKSKYEVGDGDFVFFSSAVVEVVDDERGQNGGVWRAAVRIKKMDKHISGLISTAFGVRIKIDLQGSDVVAVDFFLFQYFLVSN